MSDLIVTVKKNLKTAEIEKLAKFGFTQKTRLSEEDFMGVLKETGLKKKNFFRKKAKKFEEEIVAAAQAKAWRKNKCVFTGKQTYSHVSDGPLKGAPVHSSEIWRVELCLWKVQTFLGEFLETLKAKEVSEPIAKITERPGPVISSENYRWLLQEITEKDEEGSWKRNQDGQFIWKNPIWGMSLDQELTELAAKAGLEDLIFGSGYWTEAKVNQNIDWITRQKDFKPESDCCLTGLALTGESMFTFVSGKHQGLRVSGVSRVQYFRNDFGDDSPLLAYLKKVAKGEVVKVQSKVRLNKAPSLLTAVTSTSDSDIMSRTVTSNTLDLDD